MALAPARGTSNWSENVLQRKYNTMSKFAAMNAAPTNIWRSRISWRIALSVFLTILITSAALFVIGTLLFFAFSYGNVILAARTGGSAKAAVEKYLPKAQIRWFDEESQALQEAVSGRAHAFVSSAPLPALEAARRPTVLFHPIKDTFTKEPIGMALRRGDTELMTQVNAWIEKKEADGTLQKMREYWFQNNEWESRLK